MGCHKGWFNTGKTANFNTRKNQQGGYIPRNLNNNFIDPPARKRSQKDGSAKEARAKNV